MESNSGRAAFPIVTVGGLLQDAAEEVLLVRTHKWSGKWGIPGGKVEYGESLVTAFLREIREETGLEALEPRLMMVQDCVEHPEFHLPRHFVLMNYFAKVEGKQPKVVLNEEASDYLWISLSGSLEMDLNQPTRTLVEYVLKGGKEIWTPSASVI